MGGTFDREKVVDCMFDPVTSSILAELEDGEKNVHFWQKNLLFLKVRFLKDFLIC